MAGYSKAPKGFYKTSQPVRLAEAGIYANNDRVYTPPKHMKEIGGTDTITKQGGNFRRNAKGEISGRNGATVCKDKSEINLMCSVKVPGKKTKKRIVLGDRRTYGDELKAMIEKDEAAYRERQREKEPKIHKKLRKTKKRKALGKR